MLSLTSFLKHLKTTKMNQVKRVVRKKCGAVNYLSLKVFLKNRSLHMNINTCRSLKEVTFYAHKY